MLIFTAILAIGLVSKGLKTHWGILDTNIIPMPLLHTNLDAMQLETSFTGTQMGAFEYNQLIIYLLSSCHCLEICLLRKEHDI